MCSANKGQGAEEIGSTCCASCKKARSACVLPARPHACFAHNTVQPMQVRYLVLDEADKLFEMGFVEQVRLSMCAALTGKLRQTAAEACQGWGDEQLRAQAERTTTNTHCSLLQSAALSANPPRSTPLRPHLSRLASSPTRTRRLMAFWRHALTRASCVPCSAPRCLKRWRSWQGGRRMPCCVGCPV